MEYRKFGSLDWEVSALGFGAMRFPVLDNDSGKINEPVAMEMVRRAIDSGVNYIDTAYPYHQEQSEPFVGKVLKDGYRDKVKLATKMPSWHVKEAADFDRLLEEQLRRLDVDRIDFYLLHALNAGNWANYKKLDVFSWAEKKMAEGLFDHLCFSFHDDYPVFEEIVNGYDNWTMAQIQYNYMDTNYQAGTKGLKLAADKGLAVVIMEPLRGGRLAKNPAPPKVEEAWAKSEHDWSPAAWALQWVWNQPEVSTVLSGMSTMQQVEENLDTADQSGIGQLTAQDLALVEEAKEAYESLAPIPCTQCEYCLPCPNGVSIPKIFAIYNEAIMYDEYRGSRWAYMNQITAEARADNCIECGECEAVCPQNIEIIDWLAKAHEVLSAPQK
ncbi:MAG: aldo/keto reductase [Anaerolineaceae bacterium]|nr:aldo/keto reductase [Anaerolineaceae bacterium]